MKHSFLIALMLICYDQISAQNNESLTPAQEERLETITEKQDAETNDDSYWQLLDGYKKHPINLNVAEEEQLEDLQLLNALQIKNFISYRQLFGHFLSMYELQAIPSWDIETIRILLPYIMVEDAMSLNENLIKRMNGGENALLIRVSQQIEKSKGFEMPADSTASHYLGSPQKIFFRYRYNYKNLLQYGILGDKDAGEQFFKGAQKNGFDFYSFHFFAKDAGIIKSLALGDFTVNLGQGLIQWQSLAFTKSADALAIKRQSPVLRPYNSSGEFNFHRGAGITLQKGNWQSTVFCSFRKISANLTADTLSKEDYITSFESSGYHRTQAENADRNDLKQAAFGGNVSFIKNNYRLGINAVHYNFSRPVQKEDLPYNLFALQGKSWSDESIDYSSTYRNIHFFGEAAVDKNWHTAFVNGALISIAQFVDLSILHRRIDKAYQALYSDAFTESTTVNNENGFYSGVSISPFTGCKIDAYVDLYTFPWLKYQIDAPGSGKEYFVQLFYQPNKLWDMYTRYKVESKLQNIAGAVSATNPVAFIPKQDWRTAISIHLNKEMEIRNRVEILWYDRKASDHEQGFLSLIDFFYKPNAKAFEGNIRLQYFETGGYNSRVYVYENDVLYNFSIPSYYDKGFRYYLNISCNLKKMLRIRLSNKMNAEVQLRWAQAIYSDKDVVGTGLDQVQGNKKSEIKSQLLFSW
jgi:hypothetical protein